MLGTGHGARLIAHWKFFACPNSPKEPHLTQWPIPSTFHDTFNMSSTLVMGTTKILIPSMKYSFPSPKISLLNGSICCKSHHYFHTQNTQMHSRDFPRSCSKSCFFSMLPLGRLCFGMHWSPSPCLWVYSRVQFHHLIALTCFWF